MSAKEDVIRVIGVVTKRLNGTMYRVQTEQGFDVLAMPSGKMRKFKILLAIGDKVEMEMSPYDLTKGRITYRVRE